MIAIKYPFTLDSYGRIQTTTDSYGRPDYQKVYMDRLLTLLSTVAGQRAMNPEYGVDHSRGTFESGGDYTLGLQQAIQTAIHEWIPEVRVESVVITRPGPDGDSKVNVTVTLPDLSSNTVSVVTAYIASDGSIIR